MIKKNSHCFNEIRLNQWNMVPFLRTCPYMINGNGPLYSVQLSSNNGLEDENILLFIKQIFVDHFFSNVPSKITKDFGFLVLFAKKSTTNKLRES